MRDEGQRYVEYRILTSGLEMNDKEAIALVGSKSRLADIIDGLRQEYAGRGIAIVQSGGKWCFRTAPHRTASDDKKDALTHAVREVLILIALFGPVTRSEIEMLRGKSLPAYAIKTLIKESLIKPGKRRDTPGRPMTWVVTERLLKLYDLNRLDELPDYSKWAELRQSVLRDVLAQKAEEQDGV